jgi:hypothetical protein
VILAKDLEGLIFRPLVIAGKRVQPRLSGCHFFRDRRLFNAMDRSPSRRAPRDPSGPYLVDRLNLAAMA